MEVILREHVDNLGRRGDIVKVAEGYARNYLLPRKLALAVTELAATMAAEENLPMLTNSCRVPDDGERLALAEWTVALWAELSGGG